MNMRTDTAALAVGREQITRQAAEEIEQLADAAVSLFKANQVLGLGFDAYGLASQSRRYEALPPAEREVFFKVYNEILGNASAGFTQAGGPAPAEGASVAEIIAAQHEITNVLKDEIAKANEHGRDVVHTPPNSVGFKLAEHPEEVLKFAHQVERVEGGPKPHILLIFNAPPLEDKRTQYDVAASDLTPDTFVAALRIALKGAFDKVDVRAQSLDAYESGAAAAEAKPIDRSKVGPPQRSSAERMQEAAKFLEDTKDSIPHLAGGSIASVGYYPSCSAPIGIRLSKSSEDHEFFDSTREDVQRVIADHLSNNGYESVLDMHNLGKTLSVIGKDGEFGL